MAANIVPCVVAANRLRIEVANLLSFWEMPSSFSFMSRIVANAAEVEHVVNPIIIDDFIFPRTLIGLI